MLKLSMAIGVMMVHRHRRRSGRGAEFQQEGRAARRHEANGDIRAKQQHGQHQAGPQSAAVPMQ
jgi:hypothetical protein